MATATAPAAPFMFDLDSVPAEDRDRVEALIPEPAIADAYVGRTIKGWKDFDIFDQAVMTKKNILLAGPTGSSKTTAFRAYAAYRRLPFTVVECNAAMDPGTVLGRTTITEDGTVDYVYGDWSLIVKYGGTGLIDEINMAHPRVSAAYHQLLAVTRRMSIPEAGVTLRAGWGGIPKNGKPRPTLFCAAYNPRYQGVVRLNEALNNRFAIKFKWGYDRAVEKQLVPSERLLDMADHLRNLAEIRSPVSTNMLMEFVEHSRIFGMPLAVDIFLNAFNDEERNPVGRAIEAHSADVARQIGVQMPKTLHIDGLTGKKS